MTTKGKAQPTMPKPHPFIAELLQLEPPKTWSFIATIFGDLDGARLSGKQIGVLLAQAGIKPEASRVALHRLRNDGWIVSQKSGREVSYALSDHGRAETFAAQEDVYRQDVKFAGGWQVLGLDPAGASPEFAHVPIGKGIVLAPIAATAPNALVLPLPTGSLPDWVEACLASHLIRDQAGQLSVLALKYSRLAPALTGMEAVTARLLFIHYWRKMALRLGVWAHIDLLPDGDLARCHKAVTGLLGQTERLTPPKV